MKIKGGFTFVEVLVTLIIFIFIGLSVTNSFSNNINTYKASREHAMVLASFNEIYGYLNIYKKNYGTKNFKDFISVGDPDSSCLGNDFNGNGNLDSIDNYCFFYPHIESGNVLFENGTLFDTNSELSGVSFIDITERGKNSQEFLDVFFPSYLGYNIIIGLKEDDNYEDVFEGIIIIYNESNLDVIYSKEIIL